MWNQQARAAGRLLAALLLPALTGCTEVAIHAEDGSVRTEWHLGLVSIEMTPRERAQLLELRGVGLTAIGGGVTFGYHDETLVSMPVDDCRIVVWIKTQAKLEYITDFAARNPHVCLVGKANEAN